MATTIRIIGGVRASAVPGSSYSDPSRGRPTNSSASWLNHPLFGWSVNSKAVDGDGDGASTEASPVVDDARKKAWRLPGRLTSEKARRLRILTSETSSFHDVMYHSAIASRLASDFSHFIVSD